MTEEDVQKAVDKLIKALQPVSDRFSRAELEQRVRDKAREKGV